MFQILSQFDQNEQPLQYRPRTEIKSQSTTSTLQTRRFPDPV